MSLRAALWRSNPYIMRRLLREEHPRNDIYKQENPMNTELKKVCLNCERTDEVIPLLHLTFKNETKYICPQCLPTLIHKIHLLADKLPGAEMISTDH
jgi:hypothetical protein